MMKKIILFCFVLCGITTELSSQAYIVDEEFNSGATAPPNWTFSGGAFGSSTGSGNFGRNSPAPKFVLNAQVMTYTWTGVSNAPDNVWFVYRGEGSSTDCAASSILVEESSNGSAWTTVGATINTIQSSLTSAFSNALLSTTRYVRLTYTRSGTANCYIDDFKIRKSGSCSGTSPFVKLIVVEGSCTSGCEGGNELVFCQNGSTGLSVNDLELAIQTQGGTSPKGTIIGGNTINTNAIWTNNSSYTAAQLGYITSLNTTGSCAAGTFTTIPASNTIPANANFLLVTGATPTHTYNFSTVCGLGPFYVLFSNLDCTGKFSNGSCTQCYRTISLTNNATGCVNTETYTSGGSSSSGSGIGFNPTGSGWSNVTTSCNNFVVLPVDLIDFYATQNGDKTELTWIVESENALKNYLLEKSENGTDFQALESVQPRNRDGKITYTAEDLQPFEKLTYYRLSSTDIEGGVVQHRIISSNRHDKNWKAIVYQQDARLIVEFKNCLPDHTSISMLDMTGNTLFSETAASGKNTYNISDMASGLYIIHIQTPYKTENIKVVIP
ncbi:MAG: T9SS type A sorting domain-containing protein [Bacteroidetes bacterium]|nr:T9SS type A sorting domain-containing protein [Bacteroidota bacterium]